MIKQSGGLVFSLGSESPWFSLREKSPRLMGDNGDLVMIKQSGGPMFSLSSESPWFSLREKSPRLMGDNGDLVMIKQSGGLFDQTSPNSLQHRSDHNSYRDCSSVPAPHYTPFSFDGYSLRQPLK